MFRLGAQFILYSNDHNADDFLRPSHRAAANGKWNSYLAISFKPVALAERFPKSGVHINESQHAL